jgi:hypothetical protein
MALRARLRNHASDEDCTDLSEGGQLHSEHIGSALQARGCLFRGNLTRPDSSRGGLRRVDGYGCAGSAARSLTVEVKRHRNASRAPLVGGA